jgi:hypothetical protein
MDVMNEVLSIALIVWASVSAFLAIFAFPELICNRDVAGMVIIWWPIILIKIALKSLYDILFTGWRA